MPIMNWNSPPSARKEAAGDRLGPKAKPLCTALAAAICAASAFSAIAQPIRLDLAVMFAGLTQKWTVGAPVRFDVIVGNNGSEVRKHKLTGHVTVLHIAVRNSDTGGGLELLSARAASPHWICETTRVRATCFTDAPVKPGVQPPIRFEARATRASRSEICAEIEIDGARDASPANNRNCFTPQFVPGLPR